VAIQKRAGASPVAAIVIMVRRARRGPGEADFAARGASSRTRGRTRSIAGLPRRRAEVHRRRQNRQRAHAQARRRARAGRDGQVARRAQYERVAARSSRRRLPARGPRPMRGGEQELLEVDKRHPPLIIKGPRDVDRRRDRRRRERGARADPIRPSSPGAVVRAGPSSSCTAQKGRLNAHEGERSTSVDLSAPVAKALRPAARRPRRRLGRKPPRLRDGGRRVGRPSESGS